MNKKLLILGLIVIIGTGVYMNGLFNNDNFEVTQFGTVFDVPTDQVELIKSENGVEVFGYKQGEQFYYLIDFNATENQDLYFKFNDLICNGKKYEENGVVFYEQTSQVLGNNFNVWTGVNLAIKDQTTAGSFIKNDKTGECIVCISNNYGLVVDTLEDVEWGDKTVETTDDTVNTTLIDSTEHNTDDTSSEPAGEETTSNDLYESQFNQKDGEPKGETLNQEFIEESGASNGEELREYMENNVPEDYL